MNKNNFDKQFKKINKDMEDSFNKIDDNLNRISENIDYQFKRLDIQFLKQKVWCVAIIVITIFTSLIVVAFNH